MGTLLTMYTETSWTLIGLVIFFALFLVFVATTYLDSQKKIHAYLADLPIEKAPQGE